MHEREDTGDWAWLMLASVRFPRAARGGHAAQLCECAFRVRLRLAQGGAPLLLVLAGGACMFHCSTMPWCPRCCKLPFLVVQQSSSCGESADAPSSCVFTPALLLNWAYDGEVDGGIGQPCVSVSAAMMHFHIYHPARLMLYHARPA
mmetsp:Transcript_5024/g.11908  ORF Transcript_5024/g.11908 Transcript_5024/m.11908 type:complete len:147 (+) Transcript_5024:1943-2383(+)